MADEQANQVLLAILAMLKEQVIHSHRQHGWIIAVSETLEKHPEFAAELRAHPAFDQGPLPWIETTNDVIRRIDALIQRLRD